MGRGLERLELMPRRGDDGLAPELALAAGGEKLLALPALPGATLPRLTAWEQFRLLRTRILEAARERNLRHVLVTSSVMGEGKTLVSANLALSLSQLEDKRVLLVDADLRRPSLHTLFGQVVRCGLSDCLGDEQGWAETVLRLHPRLDYLPCRPAAERSAELLNQRRMKDLLAEFASAYDLVVVDSAPLSPIADTQILSRLVDGAVLVVRAGKAPYPLARQSAALLEPKLLGVVLNGVERPAQRNYGYGYYAPQRQDEGMR